MSLVTDTGKFTAQVDLSMGTAVTAASTINLGATTGNTIIIVGTTGIASLGTAPQAGVTRTVIFNDALVLTHSASLVLFGAANITTQTGDRAVFIATSVGIWELVSFFRQNAYTNGLINQYGIADGAIIAAKIGDAACIPSKMPIREAVTLGDSNSDLSSVNIVLKGIFVSNNSANRNRTTDSAVNIIANIPDYQIGTTFDFTVVALAAFNDTIIGGSDVNLVGNMTVNNESAVFTCIITTPTEVTIYRKS